MRVWKGQEQEGRERGKLTLFVESYYITDKEIDDIKKLLRKENISRLYLGAGKVDCMKISNIDSLKEYEVIVEISAQNFKNLKEREKFSQVIVRVDCSKDDKNLLIKLDNGKEVEIFYEGVKNTLESLKNSMYQNIDSELKL